MIFNGDLSERDLVIHSCDNPSCINPAHLSSNTSKANMLDMTMKGRARGQPNAPGTWISRKKDKSKSSLTSRRISKRLARTEEYQTKQYNNGTAPGEKHSTAKLTESQAREILSSNDPGNVLAARYGVSTPTISKIRNGHIWKHLENRDRNSLNS